MSLALTKKRTMKQFKRLSLPVLLLGLSTTSVYAANDVFKVADFLNFKSLVEQSGSVPSTFSFNGSATTFTFTSFNDFYAHAQKLSVTSIGGVLNFQGRPVTFNATKQNITLASTAIPALNGTFSSLSALQKYIDDHLAEIINQSNNGGLGNQAGNPASHVSQMSYYDSVIDSNGVAAGNLSGNSKVLAAGDATTSTYKSRFTANFRFANYTLDTTSAQLYTLSLGYNWELGNGWGVLLNAPFTYVETGVGSNTNTSYRVSLGAGVRIPVTNYLNLGRVKWDIIPLFRVGGVGLGTHLYDNTSVAYSGGVQSNIGSPLGYGFSAVMQNQYTYNTDTSLANQQLSNVTVRDINVHVYRNSIQLIKDFDAQLFGKTITTSVSVADVRFDNTQATKVDNQQEFGFNIGLKGNGVAANLVRLNMTYTKAPGYNDAFSVNIGGSF
jgi:roadblock/LC7 domain-containing protein